MLIIVGYTLHNQIVTIILHWHFSYFSEKHITCCISIVSVRTSPLTHFSKHCYYYTFCSSFNIVLISLRYYRTSFSTYICDMSASTSSQHCYNNRLRTTHLVFQYPDSPRKILQYQNEQTLRSDREEKGLQTFTCEWNIRCSVRTAAVYNAVNDKSDAFLFWCKNSPSIEQFS